MSIDRRNFLKSATMSTLSAGLALGSAHLILGQQQRRSAAGTGADGDSDFRVPIQAQQDALFYFKPSTFTPYVGDLFQAPNSRGEMVELKLLRVKEYRMSATARFLTKRARQPQSFTLSFRGEEELPPFTSIHTVSHPALGKFDLFMTSRKSDDGALVYEAVFNHIQ